MVEAESSTVFNCSQKEDATTLLTEKKDDVDSLTQLVAATTIAPPPRLRKSNTDPSKAKKPLEEEGVARLKQLKEKKEDIEDIKQLLITIGFSRSMAGKYAEILVLDHQIDTQRLFHRKVGGDIAHYSSLLKLNSDGVEILEEYFQALKVPTSTLPQQTYLQGVAAVPGVQPLPAIIPCYGGNVIDWNEFDFLEIIGRGAYSVVLKALYRHYIVAVKILTVATTPEALCKLASDELMTIRNAESKILRKETVIQALGICQGVLPHALNQFYIPSGIPGYGIVLRYEAGGSLESMLYGTPSKPKKILTLQQKIRLLMEIASGLDELHSAGILHGDIKPGNVLLSEHNPPLVRLADFGQAEVREQASNVESVLCQTVSSHRKGTPVYTAPECLPSANSLTVGKISRRTDVYSFAILAWELLNKSGNRPLSQFANELALIQNVTVNGIRPALDELADEVPPSVRHMIECCWDNDRSKRLTALQCFNTLELAYNVLSQAKFDIFFSHPWKNKNILRHVKKFLNSYGYRVWYDENEMKWDLATSMIEGIESSHIVLVCLNKLYESRENCMYELSEACKRNKNIVTLVTEPDPFSWAGSSANTAYGNVKDMCELSTKMFINIGELCTRPGWPVENDPLDTPVPGDLLDDLKIKISELIRLIQGAPLCCMPSMPSV